MQNCEYVKDAHCTQFFQKSIKLVEMQKYKILSPEKKTEGQAFRKNVRGLRNIYLL